MQAPDATQYFQMLPEKEDPFDYNYEHFRTRHLLQDGRRTVVSAGIRPGEPAPDFDLPQAGGGSVRLSDLRGKPLILHFGSYS